MGRQLDPLLSQSLSFETFLKIEQWKTELCGRIVGVLLQPNHRIRIFMESLIRALEAKEDVSAQFTGH
jgi:hypothetical protein